MSIWKRKSYSKEKPWGKETYFSSPFGMSGKLISLKKDERTSLKYYMTKNQIMYCLKGKVSVFAPDEKEFGDIVAEEGNYFNLSEGDVILIQALNPYRIKALEDSQLLEVLGIGSGGPTGEEHVMLEDDYGRKIKNPNSVEDN